MRKADRIFGRRPPRHRKIISVLVLLAILWGFGFAKFASDNASATTPVVEDMQNLGVVVLTGSADRIQWGMDALTEGRGERLLISGVNEATRREELRDLLVDPDGLFECCVDLGYTARNTIANADEAADWAAEHEFEGLWVVTSYYHMPRTLLEFRHRDPALTLYPIRVQPEGYNARNWWYPNTFRILAWEYTKYELALMRIRFANLFGL
jgi:uncharacterized SAM-binding protein YcdF (DUF218 family)